jgi:C_GCAxxG_C_C family probable redox protein
MDRTGKALSFFRKGYNCAQAVSAAFVDILPLKESDLLGIASGFGAGFGRKQLTCGAVTGGIMVLSSYYFDHSSPVESKNKCYRNVRDFHTRFTEKLGTDECIRLLGVDIRSSEGYSFAVDNDLFSVRCECFVAESVALLEEILSRNPDTTDSERDIAN